MLDESGAAELPAAAEARAAPARRRHRARHRSSIPRPTSRSTCWRARASTCAACRWSSASACCASSCPAPGRCATPTTSRSAARTSTAQVRRSGLEGMVGKRADSPYVAGRSAHWLKIRADRDARLRGRRLHAAQGPRRGLGALHLGGYERRPCWSTPAASAPASPTRSCGRFAARLDKRRVDTPPCANAPAGKEHVWVEPELVAGCATRSGPTTASSASPCSCGCATTRSPRSASCRKLRRNRTRIVAAAALAADEAARSALDAAERDRTRAPGAPAR